MRADRRRARVEQDEAARAVGRLGHARARGRPVRPGPLADRRPSRRSAGRRQMLGERLRRTAERCRALRAAWSAARRRVRGAPRPSSRRGCSSSEVREALVASVACTAPRSAARAETCRRCRKRVRRAAARRARRGRGRGSRRSWSRRNRGRARGPRGRGPGRVFVAREFGAAIGGAPILPDDGVVDRLAGARSQTIVVSRWLAISIPAIVAGAADRFADGVARGRQRRLPQVLGIVLDPAGMRDRFAETPSGPKRSAARARRTRWRAWRSFPGR